MNTRHNSGEVLAFADGHAKWMTSGDIAGRCGWLFIPNHYANGVDQWSITFWNHWGGGPAD
jgi:hypothetical protein